MRKCDKCGAPLDPQGNVCPSCGHRNGHRYLKEQPQKKTSWIWIPVALVLVAAIGTGAVLLLGNREVQLQEPSTTASLTTTQATEPPTTTEATEPPITEPPPVYRNPLNGQILEEPWSGRIFAFTISNTPEVLPHVNAVKADVVFESYGNDSVVRLLGLYSDVAQVDKIGPIRSTRLMFNDLAQHYDAMLCHAGGSSQVLTDAEARGIDHLNIDTWVAIQAGVSERDKERTRQVGYTHALMGLGPQLAEYIRNEGIHTEAIPEDYNLRFNDDGTPADGEVAEEIVITMTYKKYLKPSGMTYNPETGKYVYSQYQKTMTDWVTGEEESFRNVIVLLTEITTEGRYQVTDFLTGGDGYFACGGKLIPIKWGCDAEDQPLWFTTLDGQPLELGVGNTYIAITAPESEITYGPRATEE